MYQRIIFVLCVFIIGMSTISSQIIINSDTVFTEIIEEYEVVGHNTFINAVPQQKTYRWVRNQVVMPDPWNTAVCDANQCYLTFVDSMQITMGANASSILDVHLYLKEHYEGYALVEMTIKDVSNPSSAVSAVYIFDSETSATQQGEILQFKVYPNPSEGIFSLEKGETEVDRIQVFDLWGRELMSLRIAQREFIDLAGLQAGTYLIRLLSDTGKPMGSKLINKI